LPAETVKPRVLDADFFARPALAVARDLLGKVLVRRIGRRETGVVITETEAYIGPHDLACHGSKGRTPRTEVMFGPAGYWYVYLIYGMHWMLNVVTDEADYPSAVLFRGAGLCDGPARLTRALAIDKSFNARRAAPSTHLWIEDRGHRVPASCIRRTPRVGVDYAGSWAAKPYRFLLSPPAKLAAEIRAAAGKEPVPAKRNVARR
jgi:DNA-3-methyladenine glycosylase